MPHSPLIELENQWRHRAAGMLITAAREQNPQAKRQLEHASLCYSNCAHELHELLNGVVVAQGTGNLPTP